MMIVEKERECRLAEETEILGENLPQRHFLFPMYIHFPKRYFRASSVTGLSRSE
jgi:hypothetical protein